MNTYTSSSLYSPKHRNTIGSFPSCAQRKPRLTIVGISERLKKSIVFCHQKIIAIPSFLVAHLYESIYPTPSSSFLILSILHPLVQHLLCCFWVKIPFLHTIPQAPYEGFFSLNPYKCYSLQL